MASVALNVIPDRMPTWTGFTGVPVPVTQVRDEALPRRLLVDPCLTVLDLECHRTAR
jgi:hypothetical protein